MKENFEEQMLKQRILSKNGTFKTAFKATMGFYAAQFLATLLGLGTFGGIAYFVFKLFQ